MFQRSGRCRVEGCLSSSVSTTAWKHDPVLLTTFGSPGRFLMQPGEPPKPPGWLWKRAWFTEQLAVPRRLVGAV